MLPARRTTSHPIAPPRFQRYAVFGNNFVVGVQGSCTVAAFRYGPGQLNGITANGRLLSEDYLNFSCTRQPIQSGNIEIVTILGGFAVMMVSGHLARSGQLALPLAPLAMLSSFGPVTDIAKVAKQIVETPTASRRGSPGSLWRQCVR